jgi:nucleoside-diphosphate-sugar epimerase
MITKLTSTESEVITDDTIARYESIVWQADITKAKDLLNWRPTTSLRTGLKQTIEWYKNNISYND